MSEIANFIIIFSLIAGVANLFFPLIIKNIGGIEKSNYLIFGNFFCQFFCNLIAFGLLVTAFINDDFSISSVYLSSNSTQPLIYKISATWGNHEGSLLLWETLLTSLTMAYFCSLNKKATWRFEFLYFQSFISTCFLWFIFQASNPFTKIIPAPTEGLGLNPILQDIALAIHPPILFTAYAAFSLVYSLAIIMLKTKNNIIKELKFITQISFGLITIAIALGSWWAYRELGWGGFWFWDPVENTSLMPWLVALALIHVLNLAIRGFYINLTMLLSVLAFISCLLATFLVRSGVLTSVHSFATDSSKGFYILAIITMILAIASFYLIRNLKKDPPVHYTIFNNSTLIIINIILLVTGYITVILGTLYPLIYDQIYHEKITIGEHYFNSIGSIIVGLMLLFMIIGNYTNWDKVGNKKFIVSGLISIFISITIIMFLTNFIGQINTTSYILLTIAFAFIISQLISMFEFQNINKKAAMYLAHLGFALLIIAIIIQYEKGFDDESKIKIGETKYYENEIYVTLDGITRESSDNYKSVVAKLRVGINNNIQAGMLYPAMRFYPEQNIRTNEVSILHLHYLNDLYSTIEKLEDLDYVYLRVQYKPMMGVIWLAAIMIGCAAIMRLRRL